MFKFNFQVEDAEKEIADKKNINEKEDTLATDDFITQWNDSKEIFPSKEIIENLDVCTLNSVEKNVNGIHITHMVSGFLLEHIRDNDNSDLDIKRAEDQHSDLIPAVYEGGAKIWECTDDLLKYISENYESHQWNKKKVLDLGCGSGILGIYGLLNGAKVTFQDYNNDVLQKITIPNVFLNMDNLCENKDEDLKELEKNARFFSGDWAKWTELTKDLNDFDIILTSETIYNPQNQQKLLSCLYDKLKPQGKVLVAAKTYYFGVGGGMRQFEKLIENDKRFHYKVVWQSSEGINREIVELIKIS